MLESKARACWNRSRCCSKSDPIRVPVVKSGYDACGRHDDNGKLATQAFVSASVSVSVSASTSVSASASASVSVSASESASVYVRGSAHVQNANTRGTKRTLHPLCLWLQDVREDRVRILARPDGNVDSPPTVG